MLRRTLSVLLLSSLAACSRTPTAPSASAAAGGSASAGGAALTGQTVDAVTGSPSAHLQVSIGGIDVQTDDEGLFGIDGLQPGNYAASVRGISVVPRQTRVSTSAGRARLSLIPASFDLGAFNEMYRSEGGQLQRWRSRPALVIVATVLSFASESDGSYAAIAEQMTDEEVGQLQAHLTAGLAMLTGGTFEGFSSVSVERPDSGQRTRVTRPGAVVVARYTGIDDGDGTVGYGRWSALADGTITGGTMYLDRAFDRNDARRRLLRIHELGHALGYQHVTKRASIMNPTLGPEPTDFDRAGAVIAFDRAPGNRAPDIDPGVAGVALVTGGGSTWSPLVPCAVH